MQSADWLSLIELWPPLQHTYSQFSFFVQKGPFFSKTQISLGALEIDPKSGSDLLPLLELQPPFQRKAKLLFSSTRIECHF